MSEHIRVYADYTGCGVSSPQLREAAANLVLSQPLYGNPHSAHVLGLQSSADINSARASLLTYFDAWDEYDVIFTAGATASLRVAQEIFASMPIAAHTAVGRRMKDENDAKQQKEEDDARKDGQKDELTCACTRLSHDPRNDKYRQRIAYFCHWAAHTSLIGIRAHHQMVKFHGYRHEGDSIRRFPEPTSQEKENDGADEQQMQQLLVNPPTSEVTEFPTLEELVKAEYETAQKYLQNNKKTNDEVPPTCIIISLPLECNFTGARVPLVMVTRWAEKFKEKYGDLLDIHFLMDGAAASAKTPLRLDGSEVAAHCCSLYKMAGLPFGVGALLVKKNLIDRNLEQRLLHDGRSFYGGGTVEGLAMTSEFVSLHPGAHAWEDGTPNISALQLVPAALRQVGLTDHLNTVEPSKNGDGELNFQRTDVWNNILARSVRHEKLRRRLKAGLKALRHHNGMPVVHLLDAYFGDADGSRHNADEFSTSEEYWCAHQGAVVSFVLRTDTGLPVGHRLVERLALSHGICLRTGCFCNTGACQVFLGLTDQSLRQYLKEGNICGGPVDIIDDGTRPRGAVRLSLGWTSTEAEVDEIIAWARACFVFSAPPSTTPQQIANINNNTTNNQDATNDNYDEMLALKKQRRARIKTIWVYPVKGLAGTECASWRVDPAAGTLLLDRRFAIVDRVTGQCATPKTNSRLAQIDATLRMQEGIMILRSTTKDFDPLAIALPSDVTDLGQSVLSSCVPTAGHAVSSYTKMQIRKKKMSDSIHRPAKEYEPKVSIRGHRVETKTMVFEREVDDWLSAVLGQSVRLIMTTTEEKSATTSELASINDQNDDASSASASFANRDQSILVVSTSSHAEVERHTPEEAKPQLDVRKYRANLLVDILYNCEATAESQSKKLAQLVQHSRQVTLHGENQNEAPGSVIFPEQNWKKIIAPWASFESVGTCHRCEQVNADVATNKIESQPLAALVAIAAARLKADPTSLAHLEDGVAQQRGGVSSAPTLGQLFRATATAPRADIVKNIEAAAQILGSRGAEFLEKNGESLSSKNDATSSTKKGAVADSSLASTLKRILFGSSTKKISDGAIFKSYNDQIVLSMLVAGVGSFMYARRSQYRVGKPFASLMDAVLPHHVFLDIFSSPKFISALLSIVASIVVALVEIKILKRIGSKKAIGAAVARRNANSQNPAAITFDSTDDEDDGQTDFSVLDKMKRTPGSVSVGDILIIDA